MKTLTKEKPEASGMKKKKKKGIEEKRERTYVSWFIIYNLNFSDSSLSTRRWLGYSST
jgi:hypothetical protein